MQARAGLTGSMGGKSFTRSVTLDGEAVLMREVTIGPAKVGTLTTRTDNDTGELTMAASHGIITADKLDVYWTNTDGTVGCRYNMTVGTVAVNQVPIDGGAGDNLPDDETAVTAMVPDSETFAMVGNNVVAFGVYASVPGCVRFIDGAVAILFALQFDNARESFMWDSGNKYTNPLAGVTVATLRFSHGDSTAARTMHVGALYN